MRTSKTLCLALTLAAIPLAGCSAAQSFNNVKQVAHRAQHDFSTASRNATSGSGSGSASANSGVSGSRASGTVPAGLTHGDALAVSNADGHVVQAQPAAGSCHAIGTGLYVEPDPKCTPGALNPAVTQATINQTICKTGWTKTIRPTTSITEKEKAASMAAYGDTGSMHGFEYDHLISLELGGALNGAQNLWPEPGGVPNPKDKVETHLKTLVCHGTMTLAKAQGIIAEQWVPYYHTLYPN